MEKKIATVLFLLFVFMVQAQEQMLKGLYVDGFVDIIDIPSAEEDLLNYAKDHHFDYLIIYNINKVHRNRFPLDNEMTDDPFVKFIKKAKTEYGIKRISVVGEKAVSFDPVLRYNLNHIENDDELVDGFLLEFEFWNSKKVRYEGDYCEDYLKKAGIPCNRSGAFYFYMEQLKTLRSVASEFQINLESYVGSVSKEEMQKLIQYLNAIHIDYYRKDLKKMADYKANRLDAIIDGQSKVEVFPIFSSREKHMKKWLHNNDIDDVFPVYLQMLEKDKNLYPILSNIKGHSWYRYSSMPK